MTESFEELEKRIGWTFKEQSHLLEALTHSTFANENQHLGPDNERLEFLGDAVLDLVVAELLYRDPNAAGEGEMSRRRSRVVRRSALAKMARTLEIEPFIRLGEGQRKSGGTESILADAYEALIGAVFLDGGYAAVLKCFGGELERAVVEAKDPVDFKTRLQELCHQLGVDAPQYDVVGIDGPDHAREFRCEVTINGEVRGRGIGSSKKAAEQECARQATEELSAKRERTSEN